MFTQVLTAFKVLDQSSNSVFFEKPTTIQINEEAVTKYASSQKIEVLIEELKEKGPFIALGKIGPSAYIESPFKLKDQFCGKDIHGWKPGATRTNSSTQSCLLILGAKKNDEREHVYFTLSQDITMSSSSSIRDHKPSNTDHKIYAVSHKTFLECLFDLYPCTASSFTPEQNYAQNLSLLPLNSIIDMGDGEANCKAIGQKAFNEFKEKANGNSFAGAEAVKKIFNLTASVAKDGSRRKQFIERAWEGIGDDNWRWRA